MSCLVTSIVEPENYPSQGTKCTLEHKNGTIKIALSKEQEPD